MNLGRPPIPVVDVRNGGVVQHAQESAGGARSLREACLAFFPGPLRPVLPLLDFAARAWLARSASPYGTEIREVARVLGFSGVWFLNGSYQWACTASSREQNGVPWLGRTLDWPFPGLGRQVEVARMSGAAGDYFNVTWPGFVGVLTAMAPGRFAACINQAPLERRTRHRWLRPADLAGGAVRTILYARAIPPDHLLRQVFETCATFADAKRVLETTPIARAAIFTLAGCQAGERCVIERTETGVVTHVGDTTAANDWRDPREGWEARIGTRELLTQTYETARERSLARREGLARWSGRFADDSFDWVQPPVLNKYTRLAVEMCPAEGVLRVMGYEANGDDAAVPVTQPLIVQSDRVAASETE